MTDILEHSIEVALSHNDVAAIDAMEGELTADNVFIGCVELMLSLYHTVPTASFKKLLQYACRGIADPVIDPATQYKGGTLLNQCVMVYLSVAAESEHVSNAMLDCLMECMPHGTATHFMIAYNLMACKKVAMFLRFLAYPAVRSDKSALKGLLVYNWADERCLSAVRSLV